MKVVLKQIRENLRPNQVGIVKEFINFLQANAPLRNKVIVLFQDERNESMTTGRHQENVIYVFSRSRILIDILRTLAHEWIHAIQNQNLETEPQLERPSEDQANSVAGFLIRKFVKDNPEHEVEVYKD